MALIYEIDAEGFLDLVNDYPAFGAHIYIRGEVRMAYFKYLTALREGEYSFNMKIIEIEKHIQEGIRRSQPREWTDMERRLYGSSVPFPVTNNYQKKEIDEEATLKEA